MSQMLHVKYDADDDHNEQQLLQWHRLLPRAINKKWSLQKAHTVVTALKTYLLKHCFYSVDEFLLLETNTNSNQLYHIIHE
jgi:hypothetical protein